MKLTPFISLIVLGTAIVPITVPSQGHDTAANAAILEKLTAARDAEEQQNFEAKVQHNRDLAEKQQAQAAGEYQRANAMFKDRLQAIVRRGPGSPGRSLVIRSSELEVKDQANLEEDLVVMSHVLEKSVGSVVGAQATDPVLGVNVVFAGGHEPGRAMYLEGYGALFTLSVGFPLLPSAKESDEKENASADSAWNEARQEVFGQRMDGRGGYVRGEEYDERKVNTLKDTVLEALKNATHIRGLKSDDSVTVCVFGGGAALPLKLIAGNKPGAPKPKEVYVAERAERRSTMLTIRVKKADVDSFAKDKLNLDDFRKKAKIMPYAGAVDSPRATAFGGGVTGGGGGFGANPGY